MKKFSRRTSRLVPVLVFVLLLLGALACGQSTPTQEPPPSAPTPPASQTQPPPEEPTSVPAAAATPTDTAVPTPAPTDTPEPEARHLGDVLEDKGYLLCALAVEDPATRPGLFYEAEAGKKLVAVQFIVGNVSGETMSSNVLYATLVDSDGFAYGADSGIVEDSIELLDVGPGEKVRGWAGFIVPEGSIPASLKYEVSARAAQTLQVGLAKPEGPVQEPAFVYSPDGGLPRLGEVAEGFGYSLSVSTVEDPATRPGIFYRPEPGKKLVGVEFIVGNVSGETISSNVLYSTLIDAEGFLYGAESGVVEDSIELLDLNAGEKAKGWAGFILPDDSIPVSFRYQISARAAWPLQVRLIAQ